MGNTFSKKERLKSRKTIDLLFKEGKAINAFPYRAVYMPKQEKSEVLLNAGFVVPKKNIKLAVNRNLMKRRMREAYRLNNKALKLLLENREVGLDVMFIYLGKQISNYQETEEKIKVILTRLTEGSEVVSQ